RDDIEVASNPTPRRERSIAQRRLQDFPQVIEIPIQHLARERLLGREVVCERPLWSAGFGHDVANAGAAIAALEHDLAPRGEELLAMRWLGHQRYNTDVRIVSSSDRSYGSRPILGGCAAPRRGGGISSLRDRLPTPQPLGDQ